MAVLMMLLQLLLLLALVVLGKRYLALEVRGQLLLLLLQREKKRKLPRFKRTRVQNSFLSSLTFCRRRTRSRIVFRFFSTNSLIAQICLPIDGAAPISLNEVIQGA